MNFRKLWLNVRKVTLRESKESWGTGAARGLLLYRGLKDKNFTDLRDAAILHRGLTYRICLTQKNGRRFEVFNSLTQPLESSITVKKC
jgi:hypothetical protein